MRDMPSEIEDWADVPGFEGFYSVSSFGRVRREKSTTCAKAGAILSAKGTARGYPVVSLCRPGRKWNVTVHKLVAAAHLPPRPSPAHNPNHIDLDRTNNRSDNLEWLTQGDNCRHAYKAGARDARGQGNGQAVLTEADVLAMRAKYPGARGDYADAGREFGVSARHAADIIKRTRWGHLP